jgi:hypothetical protein
MVREYGSRGRRGGQGFNRDRQRRERPWGDDDRREDRKRPPRGSRGGRRGRGGQKFRRDDEVGGKTWKHDQFNKLDPKQALDKKMDAYWMKDEGRTLSLQMCASRSSTKDSRHS